MNAGHSITYHMVPPDLPVHPMSQKGEVLVDDVPYVSSFLVYWAESWLMVWPSYAPSLVLFPHTSCRSCPETSPVITSSLIKYSKSEGKFTFVLPKEKHQEQSKSSEKEMATLTQL
jgi:hypothetical protein